MGIAAALLCVLLQDPIDNPEYKGWASFKAGSVVTYKYIKDGAAQPGLQKTTLVSIDEKEAVLETTYVLEGKDPGKPLQRKVPAKAPAASAPPNVKEGEEEIEVAGKTLKCRTKEFEKKLASGKTAGLKYWIHAEIPGMVAKVETTNEGGPKVLMVASEWEKK